jgi:hypothetical protein
MAFLTDRKMTVRYKGKQSSVKSLPGGGPQGTLLGLLLFIVLINYVGFDGQKNNTGDLITSKRNMKTANLMHLKFVDDLTLAEAINLPNKLKPIPANERPQPDTFHARTGHILPQENSELVKELLRTSEYLVYEMKINQKKPKVMLFNPCKSIDFMLQINLENCELEVVEEMRLLGLILRSDMKWTSNTDYMIKRANKKLWMIRRLKYLGADTMDLTDIYIKQIRSLLELAAPVWHGGISQLERLDIERVQKSVAHNILDEQYSSYKDALVELELESLESRRGKLCLKFTKKAEKHEKHQNWFKLNGTTVNTRQQKNKYCDVRAFHTRFQKSPISFLTKLLNEHYIKKV